MQNGADFTILSMDELPFVIEETNPLLLKGKRPFSK